MHTSTHQLQADLEREQADDREGLPPLNPVDPADPVDTVTGEDGRVRPRWASSDPGLASYYDEEWGTPVTDERGLYERISLEGFQSGLSWVTILRKREAFRSAFHGFDIDTVAGFGEADVERLLQDAGIIRHRGKINAAINNARAAQALREDGGLVRYVWRFAPERTPLPATQAAVPTQSVESVALAKALRAKGFKFVGPTTMFALMEAVGMVDTNLLSTHRRGTSGLFHPDGERVTARFAAILEAEG